MRVRNWKDILSDVSESNADASGWRAVAGNRQSGIGEVLFLGHPNVGVYEMKTYSKNPRQLRGVGAKVARRIDDELDPLFPRQDHAAEDTPDQGRFAVQSPPSDEEQAKSMAKRVEETIKVHAEAPTSRDDFFEDMMDAVESPAFGPMQYEFDDRPDELDQLSSTFSDADELLTKDLDQLVDEDEVGRGFQ